jgi:hypothetical protein
MSGEEVPTLPVDLPTRNGQRFTDEAARRPVRARLIEEPTRFAVRERGDVELKGVPGRWPLYAVDAKGGVR